jgi:site-specific DNA-methyltransferase (adenine-specific)
MPLLLNEDALTVLPTLRAGSVDAIITDPPYSPGGASPVSRGAAPAHKVQASHATMKYPFLVGASRDQRGQLAWMACWLAECWRVGTDNSVLLMFSDWRQLPLFTDAVQAGGWCWRGLVVWDKTKGSRPNKGYFRHQAEYVIFATHGAWKPPTGECLPGVFSFPSQGGWKNNLTAKPVPLIIELMKILPQGIVVLDPFMGGGAVPRACALTGRDYIGIEIQPESYGNAKKLVGLPEGAVQRLVSA